MSEIPFLLFTVSHPHLGAELSLLQGGFYGALSILGIYNLFLYVFTKSRSYLFYVGFIVSFLFYQLVHNGTALHYFWPEQITLNSYAYPLFFTLNTLAISFFVPSFLNLDQHSSNLFRVFRGFSALVLVSMIAFPILKLDFIEPLYNALSLIIILSSLLAGAFYWLKGNQSARLFTIAWATYIAGLIVANNGNPQAFSLFSLISIVLLGVALADRLTQKQKQILQAHDDLLNEQRSNITELQEYVDLYQNSLMGKFQLDRDGYFVKTNAAWREILGYWDKQQFAEENPQFDTLFTDAKTRRRFWRELKENGQIKALLVSFTQPTTNESIVVSLTISQSNYEHFTWFGSGQDVTEHYLKEQNQILLQKEKAQSLRQLIAGLTEEIETPINKLRNAENYLQVKEKDLSEEDRLQMTQGLTLIKQGAERLHQLTQLMHSSIISEERFPQETIRIRDWLNEWQQSTQEKNEHLQVKTAVHSYLVEWLTWPDALCIILNQLVRHSCMRNHQLLDEALLKVSIEIRERGEFLELRYCDNGKNLTHQEKNTLFLPFHSTNDDKQHRDLGLYQSYNLITELLEGVIEWPETEEGMHLLVRLQMPL